MKWPDELVAAHELGHLVVAKEGGLESPGIKLMSSWWSGDITAGVCLLDSFMYPVPGNNPEPGGWDLFRAMLIMTAGGQAASEHWFRLHDMPVDFTAASDRDAFRKDARIMPNAPSWDQAMAESRVIVETRWDEIEALTPELIERGKMAGKRVS